MSVIESNETVHLVLVPAIRSNSVSTSFCVGADILTCVQGLGGMQGVSCVEFENYSKGHPRNSYMSENFSVHYDVPLCLITFMVRPGVSKA